GGRAGDRARRAVPPGEVELRRARPARPLARRRPRRRLRHSVITLYPAIDLQEGRAVRLLRGDFAQPTVFSEDPVAQARAFAHEGASALHVVDLDGAREGAPMQAPLVATIAAAFPGHVHLGGGLRSRAAIETAIATGVH